MNLPKKSEHKQAVQTSQRALQGVSNIQEAIAGLALTTKLTTPQKLALIATVAGGTGTAAVAAYSFWPSIEIQTLMGDLTADPIEAKFQFRNAGRLDLAEPSHSDEPQRAHGNTEGFASSTNAHRERGACEIFNF